MYEYKADVVRVIDGDTVVARVDLGFHVSVLQTFRLHAINAPEIRGRALTPDQRAKGIAASRHLEQLIAAHYPITISTLKDRTGKYGRYLAVLYGKGDSGPVNLNLAMVQDGHALPQ